MTYLHLLDSRNGQDNLQASHPASFQHNPSFCAHSVMDSRIYKHNNGPVHQSASYSDGLPQRPNFRRQDHFPPANDRPEYMDPMYGIGFYHNGLFPNSNSVKSLTWSSQSRLASEDTMQYQRRGSVSRALPGHESKSSASVEPEAHRKSRLARSQAEIQGKAVPAIPANFGGLDHMQVLLLILLSERTFQVGFYRRLTGVRYRLKVPKILFKKEKKHNLCEISSM